KGAPIMSFPLPFVPKHTYHAGGCRFGADRPNGRKHAACDLLAPLDTPVLAVARGIILRSPYKFYRAKNHVWTYALESRVYRPLHRGCPLRRRNRDGCVSRRGADNRLRRCCADAALRAL